MTGEWRCSHGAVRPLFGLIDGAEVHVKISGRRSFLLYYVVNFEERYALAHCPACHEWLEVRYDTERRAITQGTWAGRRPWVPCECTA